MKLEKEVYINDYEFDCFDNDLKYDIVEFYRENYFTDEERKFITETCSKKLKLTLEVEEPILNDSEKKYLSNVIKPFKDRIEFIKKSRIYGQEYINVVYNSEFENDNNFCLPVFKKGTMYKGMELNKQYTLEELGL